MRRESVFAVVLVCVAVVCAQTTTPHEVTSLPGFSKPLLERSWTGFLSTNSSNGGSGGGNGSLFYWYYESRGSPATDPLILWVQGGPGCSSELGMLGELGPYHLLKDLTLTVNPYSWNTRANLLFIDQPVGTGFSIAQPNAQTPTDMVEVGQQLAAALDNFYALHPELNGRAFYLSAESYGGKFIPYTATQLLLNANPAINVKGLMIGDGWTAPLTQTGTVGVQAFQLGLIDENELSSYTQMLAQCTALVQAEDWAQAQVFCDAMDTFVVNASGGINIDDVRQFGGDDKDTRLTQWLNAAAVQQALGLPFVNANAWAECSGAVAAALATDEMKDAVQLLPNLLANTRVMLYNGNFDLNCGVTGTEAYLQAMQWPGLSAYKAAPKQQWRYAATNATAGYVRQALTLTQVVVMHAGHMVPKTQPAHSYDMITRFINQQPWD